MRDDVPMSLFFEGFPEAEKLYAVVESLYDRLPTPPDVAVTKSQIAVRRDGHAFAWLWVPARYLSGAVAPLVLSVRLDRRDRSPRWKEVVEPSPGRYMHHLEVRSERDLDEEVLGWLVEAWGSADPHARTGMTPRDDPPPEKET